MFKKLGLAIVGASIFVGGFFVQPQVAHADPLANAEIQTNKEEGEKTSVLLNKVSQGLYAMTWPIMVLAGTFTDNDVIYGTFIGLDKSLWGIWNMMRTFANFFIGFLFIVAIMAYFWGIQKDKFSPAKILPQMVLASVLVNASWFIIGALLDISTITTYAVGLLPMKVDDTMKDIAIPQVTITLAPTNSESKFKVELCGKYEPCVFDVNGNKATANDCYDKGKLEDVMVYKYYSDTEHITKGTQITNEDHPNCIISKDDMLDNMKNLTGPFVSIFQSLMDSSQVAKNESSMTPATNVSITIMKAIFLIALLIPLITLCIILVVRAILLWMIIVFSPLIFLFTAITGFKDLKDYNLTGVLTLIFLPVFVTFALSMSLVFMNALHKSQVDTGAEGPKLLSHFGCEPSPDKDERKLVCSIKEGTDIEIELAKNDKSTGGLLKDLGKWIGRIISNLFGIGFMWVIVFAALKSSKITEGIASSIEKFSTSMAKAAPLIPVAGAGMQSLSSLKKGAQQVSRIPQQMQQKQYQDVISKRVEEAQQDFGRVDQKNSVAAKKAGDDIEILDKEPNISEIKEPEKNASFGELTPEQKTNMATGLKGTGISREAIDIVSKSPEAGNANFNITNTDATKALNQQQNRINLRDYLKKSFIAVNLSLFQAIEFQPGIGDKFDAMYKECGFESKKIGNMIDIAKKGIHDAATEDDVVSLMKNFDELGIVERDDIFKLLVEDLMSDQVVEKDKKVLDELYNNHIRDKKDKS